MPATGLITTRWGRRWWSKKDDVQVWGWLELSKQCVGVIMWPPGSRDNLFCLSRLLLASRNGMWISSALCSFQFLFNDKYPYQCSSLESISYYMYADSHDIWRRHNLRSVNSPSYLKFLLRKPNKANHRVTLYLRPFSADNQTPRAAPNVYQTFKVWSDDELEMTIYFPS